MKPNNLKQWILFIGFLSLSFLVACNPTPSTTPTGPPTLSAHEPSITPITPIPPTLIPTRIFPTSTETHIPRTSTPTRLPTRTPKLATSTNDIVGIWLGIENRDGMYFQFNEDGTCRQSKVRRTLDTQPNVECIFSFDGAQLIITVLSVYNLPDCGPDPAIYQVELLSTGQIEFLKVKDSCSQRVNTIAQIHERRP